MRNILVSSYSYAARSRGNNLGVYTSGMREDMGVTIGGYAAFTLYIGAAFNEASPSQRVLLRTKCQPMLNRMRELSGDAEQWAIAARSLLIRIHEVLGEEWTPKEETMRHIRSLMAEDRDAFQIRKTT